MPIDDEQLTASLRQLAARHEPDDSEVVAALREVALACVDIFGVAGSGIMVADEQNVTRYLAASDGPGRLLEQAEAQTGQGVCTSAFMDNRVVDTEDIATDRRWPELAAALSGLGVHAVLGVPVRLGGIPVGTLNVYRDRPSAWDDSERRALVRYGVVVATTLSAALRAHTAGTLVDQLQYALDYRVLIERAVGYLMASERIDGTAAFSRLRRSARNRRVKIGQVAEELLASGRLPAERR